MLKNGSSRMQSAIRSLAAVLLVCILASCGDDDTDKSVCQQWYEYMDQNCAEEPLDPVEVCQAIDTLKSNSGCQSQYDALLSCIDENSDTWACDLPACHSEASAVNDCVEPYCAQHPADCSSPY